MVEPALDAYGRSTSPSQRRHRASTSNVAGYPDQVWDRVRTSRARDLRAMKAQITAMRRRVAGTSSNHRASLGGISCAEASSPISQRKIEVDGDEAHGWIRSRRHPHQRRVPGIIDTPLLEHGKKIPGLIESLQASVPQGRLGLAEEVAALCASFASEESSYMDRAVER